MCVLLTTLIISNTLIRLYSNSSLLNSKVVTVTVSPSPNLLSSPIEIEFPHLHNVSLQSSLVGLIKK